jgi:hypothetical protein
MYGVLLWQTQKVRKFMKMQVTAPIVCGVMKPSMKDANVFYPTISIVDSTTGDTVVATATDARLVEIANQNLYQPCKVTFEYNLKYGSVKVCFIEPAFER